MDDTHPWFRTLLETAPFGIVLVNPAGQITVLNSRTEQQFGYAPGELRGQELALLLPERVQALHDQYVHTFFDNPQVRPMGIGMELIGRRKDGSEFPIEVGLGWLESATEPLAIAFITDITERHEMEAALEHERNLRRIHSLDQLSANHATAVTASVFGLTPLRQSAAQVFQNMVQQYGQLLDMAVEQRTYKVNHDLSAQLQDLADQLGFLGAGPRDVVEIHTVAVRQRIDDSPLQKRQIYIEEGGIIVLEFMGHLVSYYRNNARRWSGNEER